jgi:hypothetical protein
MRAAKKTATLPEPSLSLKSLAERDLANRATCSEEVLAERDLANRVPCLEEDLCTE